MKLRRVPEKIGRERFWKLESTIAGMLGAMLAKRVIKALYAALSSRNAPETPFDPRHARFSWPDAILWAAAAGIGLGIAKVVSARAAAIGWQVATGTSPPGVAERANA